MDKLKLDERFLSKDGSYQEKDYMGKKTFRNSFDSSNEVFKVNFNNPDEDNIQITVKEEYKKTPKIINQNYSNAIQLFTKN